MRNMQQQPICGRCRISCLVPGSESRHPAMFLAGCTRDAPPGSGARMRAGAGIGSRGRPWRRRSACCCGCRWGQASRRNCMTRKRASAALPPATSSMKVLQLGIKHPPAVSINSASAPAAARSCADQHLICIAARQPIVRRFHAQPSKIPPFPVLVRIPVPEVQRAAAAHHGKRRAAMHRPRCGAREPPQLGVHPEQAGLCTPAWLRVSAVCRAGGLTQAAVPCLLLGGWCCCCLPTCGKPAYHEICSRRTACDGMRAPRA